MRLRFKFVCLKMGYSAPINYKALATSRIAEFCREQKYLIMMKIIKNSQYNENVRNYHN